MIAPEHVSDLPVQDVESYLGDGLYVSFDGWQIFLRARRADRDHIVALEPEVYRALRGWIARHRRLALHMEAGQ